MRAVQDAILLDKERVGYRVVEDAYGREPCVYCGAVATSRDHVVPESRGGRNSLDNMVPACRRCNGRKRDLMPGVFFAANPRLAWRFARRARFAKPVYIEMAREFGRKYEGKAVFEEEDIENDDAL